MQFFLLIVHILVAFLLVVVILIQRGRGSGLVESLSGMESMFGTKTSQFLTRTTTILATLFLLTSISLALIAARQTRSLMNEKAIPSEQPKMPSAGEKIAQEKQEETAKENQPLQQPNLPAAQEQAVPENKIPD